VLAQMIVTITDTASTELAVAWLGIPVWTAPSDLAPTNARDTVPVTSTCVNVMKVTLDLIAL